MSRLITSIGALAPAIPNALKTFDADFTRPGALTLGQWGPQGYPWLYEVEEGDTSGSVPGSYLAELLDTNGNWQTVTQEPQPRFDTDVFSGGQTNINSELQFYAPNHILDQYGIQRLNRIVNGVLEMHAIETPDVLKDIAVCSVDVYGDYTVASVDRNTREITVNGLTYKRERPSDDNSYARGDYTGFNRFFRDELNNDPSLDQSWKRRKHDYGWIRIQPTTGSFKKVRYDRVIDSPSVDQPSGNSSTHKIRLQDGQMSATEWDEIQAGGVIKLFRRLPWTAQMETTSGTFSQKYFITESVMKLHNDSFQFFAWWFWGQYLKFFRPQNNVPIHDFDSKWTGATELDGIESPGGTRGFRRVHNIHAAGVGGMYDYAAQNGITPEMPLNSAQFDPNRDNSEWDSDTQAGHTTGIQLNDPGNVNYDDWFRLRIEWVPPNSEWNPRPIGVIRWYVGPENGELRYLCGTITPPWWDSNPGAPKRIFMNNAVGGKYVNDTEFVFDTSGGAGSSANEIINYVRSMEVYQWPGYEAGGAGYPDYNKQFSRSYFPTPGDPTGNSGTGIVQADGSAGGVPGNNQPTTPTADGSSRSYKPVTDEGIRFSQGLVAGIHQYELKNPDHADTGTFDFSSYGNDAELISGDRGPTLVLRVGPTAVDTPRTVTFNPD